MNSYSSVTIQARRHFCFESEEAVAALFLFCCGGDSVKQQRVSVKLFVYNDLRRVK